MNVLKVKPKEGLLVPYPRERRFLPAEGAEVQKSSYWLKRLKDGDIIEIKEKEEAQVQSPPKRKTKNKNQTMEVES